MLEAGAYEGVDVNLMAHPGSKSDNALVCSAAFQSFKIEYFGRQLMLQLLLGKG
jgi:hypothetical protein